MDLATDSESDGGWELCNNDGFIYKRKKRRLDPSSAAPRPAESSAAEEKFRRVRRKKTLLRIKDRYQRELALWEHLSVTCRAMQDSAEQIQREDEEEERDGTSPPGGPPDAEVLGKENGLEDLIDKLLLKVNWGGCLCRVCLVAENCRKQHCLPYTDSCRLTPKSVAERDSKITESCLS